jgi:hypothetical protein
VVVIIVPLLLEAPRFDELVAGFARRQAAPAADYWHFADPPFRFRADAHPVFSIGGGDAASRWRRQLGSGARAQRCGDSRAIAVETIDRSRASSIFSVLDERPVYVEDNVDDRAPLIDAALFLRRADGANFTPHWHRFDLNIAPPARLAGADAVDDDGVVDAAIYKGESDVC